MSAKTYKCEACRGASETLHMRNSDGKWVCAVHTESLAGDPFGRH